MCSSASKSRASVPSGCHAPEARAQAMWAKIETATFESALPRPKSQPSRISAPVGGTDQELTSPNGAVSRQAFRQYRGGLPVPTSSATPTVSPLRSRTIQGATRREFSQSPTISMTPRGGSIPPWLGTWMSDRASSRMDSVRRSPFPCSLGGVIRAGRAAPGCPLPSRPADWRRTSPAPGARTPSRTPSLQGRARCRSAPDR